MAACHRDDGGIEASIARRALTGTLPQLDADGLHGALGRDAVREQPVGDPERASSVRVDELRERGRLVPTEAHAERLPRPFIVSQRSCRRYPLSAQ